MGRIERAFERRYMELLGEFGVRDRSRGLAWLQVQSSLQIAHGAKSLSHAHAQTLINLLQKVHRFRNRKGQHQDHRARVFCDAGLGGLSRWLRATGTEAYWKQDIPDGELVSEAQRLGATLITTDSLLLERRPIMKGEVRAIWVPPSLKILEQLRLVRAELGLPEPDSAESRCMRCGGELVEVQKEHVKERIPPRTYRWLDEFFECCDCHQLFWNGTHWQRIRARLADIRARN